jgi:hypothetical protein|tara:strand:- start:453 stop:758 length:306 start_codon:yes stop_codon:yes gene_type:complete
MIKQVPDEVMQRHAKEVVDWIFEESGVHQLSMTCVEGKLDYNILRDDYISLMHNFLAEETLIKLFKMNGGTSWDQSTEYRRETDDQGRTTKQLVVGVDVNE